MRVTTPPYFHLLALSLKSRSALLYLTLLVTAVYNILELLYPKLLQLFVDAIQGNPLSFLGLKLSFISVSRVILFIPVILLILGFLRWFINYNRSVLQTRLGQGALYSLRSRIYNTVQALSFSYHNKAHSGTLISNVVEDVAYVSRFFEWGLFPLVEAIIYIAFLYLVMFTLCWQAAAVSILMYLISFTYLLFFFTRGRLVFSESRNYFANIVEAFSENIEGHLVVNAYGQHAQQKRKYDTGVSSVHKYLFKETFLNSMMTQSQVWAATLGIPVVAAIGLWVMRQSPGAMTTGEFFMLLFLQHSLNPRVRMLTHSLDLFMRFSITADRLFKLFTTQSFLEDKGKRLIDTHDAGNISVSNLSFAYNSGQTVLKDISFNIQAGETIGIVGTTGSGKSTLALLICRFYDPQAGSILIDGEDIQRFSVNSIRDQFSLVFQDTFLFSASIRDNIAYGAPQASFEDIIHASTVAHAHSFIMKMPNKYDTEVGEKGLSLSGGQRQRISLARAIVRKPRFLILDASTSALDTTTEAAVQDSLINLKESTTTIIIGHRYSSIAGADRILVMDQGRIVEQGPPGVLNNPGTLFSKILQTQGAGV